MSFPDAVKLCLTQKYADFSGRARRSEFWFFSLFTLVVSLVAAGLDNLLRTPTILSFRLIGLIVLLALLAPTLAVGARRLHDTGRPTWLLAIGWAPYILGVLLGAVSAGLALLLMVVALVGFIVLLVFYVQDSKPDNEYGPNPKALAGQAYQQAPPPQY